MQERGPVCACEQSRSLMWPCMASQLTKCDSSHRVSSPLAFPLVLTLWAPCPALPVLKKTQEVTHHVRDVTPRDNNGIPYGDVISLFVRRSPQDLRGNPRVGFARRLRRREAGDRGHPRLAPQTPGGLLIPVVVYRVMLMLCIHIYPTVNF